MNTFVCKLLAPVLRISRSALFCHTLDLGIYWTSIIQKKKFHVKKVKLENELKNKKVIALLILMNYMLV